MIGLALGGAAGARLAAHFFAASQELDRREIQKTLEAERAREAEARLTADKTISTRTKEC